MKLRPVVRASAAIVIGAAYGEWYMSILASSAQSNGLVERIHTFAGHWILSFSAVILAVPSRYGRTTWHVLRHGSCLSASS
jgi:hypothetical protein